MAFSVTINSTRFELRPLRQTGINLELQIKSVYEFPLDLHTKNTLFVMCF